MTEAPTSGGTGFAGAGAEISRAARVFWTGFVLHFKHLSASPFMVMTAALWPLVYATLAFLMFRATNQAPSLLYAALGAAVMGIWSTTATSAGGAIQSQRWYGVLELLAATPTRLILVFAPITVAIAGIGVYSIASTLLWGRLLFGVPIHVLHPVLFALAIPAAVLSIGMLGLVLASSLVLYRSASAFSQALEYPIWLITGMLIPLSLLPGWIDPVAWALAPTWGMRAVRRAAIGGEVGTPLLVCAALTVAYTGLAMLLLHHFERLARERATLSLT